MAFALAEARNSSRRARPIVGSAVAAIFGETHIGAIITAVFASASLFVELTTRSFGLSEQIAEHRRAAVTLWTIRERYTSLITDFMDSAIEPWRCGISEMSLLGMLHRFMKIQSPRRPLGIGRRDRPSRFMKR
jgi:hypothetical protein